MADYILRPWDLATHSVVLSNNNRNVVIGNGDALETITVTFDETNITFTASPDGSTTKNINHILTGSATLTLHTTNEFCDILIDLFKYQRDNATDRTTMVIKDSYGNINATFQDANINKIPDYAGAREVGTRDFVIAFARGIV